MTSGFLGGSQKLNESDFSGFISQYGSRACSMFDRNLSDHHQWGNADAISERTTWIMRYLRRHSRDAVEIGVKWGAWCRAAAHVVISYQSCSHGASHEWGLWDQKKTVKRNWHRCIRRCFDHQQQAKWKGPKGDMWLMQAAAYATYNLFMHWAFRYPWFMLFNHFRSDRSSSRYQCMSAVFGDEVYSWEPYPPDDPQVTKLVSVLKI